MEAPAPSDVKAAKCCERCMKRPWSGMWLAPDDVVGHEILVCDFCYRELWEASNAD